MQLGLFATPDRTTVASGGYPCGGWQVHAAAIWREGACSPAPLYPIVSDVVARATIDFATDPLPDGVTRWASAKLEGCWVVADDNSARAEVDPGFLPALQGWLRLEVTANCLFSIATLRVECWRPAIGGLRLVAVVMSLKVEQ